MPEAVTMSGAVRRTRVIVDVDYDKTGKQFGYLRVPNSNNDSAWGAVAIPIVVVKNGTVLAVEGFEGTDKCLLRGGELAGKDGGSVAVKVAKENHDLRFDIPCIGPQTLETCVAARISTLALESGRALLLEPEICEQLARKHKITLTTVA